MSEHEDQEQKPAERTMTGRKIDLDEHRRDAAEERVKHLRDGISKEFGELEQILGKALGCPTLYPDASDVDDGQVCVGVDVAVTLAQQVVERLDAAEAKASALDWLEAHHSPEIYRNYAGEWVVKTGSVAGVFFGPTLLAAIRQAQEGEA